MDAVAARDPYLHRPPQRWVPIAEEALNSEGDDLHHVRAFGSVGSTDFQAFHEWLCAGFDGLDAVQQFSAVQ